MRFKRRGEEGGRRICLDLSFQEVRRHDGMMFCSEGRMMFCLNHL